MKLFKPGEQVQHRPSGRIMTVETVFPDDFFFRYRCKWRDGQRVVLDYFADDEVEPIPGEVAYSRPGSFGHPDPLPQ